MSISREKALRNAYFNVLNGNLSYNSINVPVFDNKVESPNDSLYVLLTDQASSYNGNFARAAWDSLFQIKIISKQYNSVSKDIVDDICQQIEDIISPDTTTIGLQAHTGWQIINVYVNTCNYTELEISSTQTVIQKIVTFSNQIIKLS